MRSHHRLQIGRPHAAVIQHKSNGERSALVFVRCGSGAGDPPVDGLRAPVVRGAQFAEPGRSGSRGRLGSRNRKKAGTWPSESALPECRERPVSRDWRRVRFWCRPGRHLPSSWRGCRRSRRRGCSCPGSGRPPVCGECLRHGCFDRLAVRRSATGRLVEHGCDGRDHPFWVMWMLCLAGETAGRVR